MKPNRRSWLSVFVVAAISFTLSAVVLFVVDRPQVEWCCGTQDTDIREVNDGVGVDAAAARKTYKIWIAPGTVSGISESDFRRRVMAALRELSEFTLVDFVLVNSKSGAHTQIYPATDDMIWKKIPKWKRDNIVSLGLQQGTWIYLTTRPRWSGERILEACVIHEFGHRVGIRHTQDKTSIMHPWLTSVSLNPTDKINFQKRLGKRSTAAAESVLEGVIE
jgi:hypothetical protein